MESFQANMLEYKKQLEKGHIKKAYNRLMKYIMGLRADFKNKYPEYYVGGIYNGYMDMTYFPISSKSLKRRKLKVAIVFNHDTFQFEAWLSGSNKNIQNKYWKLVRNNKWDKYTIPSSIKGIDSIVENTLVQNPDFNDLNALTKQIEKGTLKFIKDIEGFLSKTGL